MHRPTRQRSTLAAVLALATLAAGCSEVLTSPTARPNASPQLSGARTPTGANAVAAVGSTVYLTQVVSSAQGLTKAGTPVPADRSNPNFVLGPADDVFFSLGFGGTLTARFEKQFSGTLLLSFEQTIVPTYPREAADVYVSANGVDFVFIGQIDNVNNQDQPVRQDAIPLPSGCWQYVRLVDKTNSNDPAYATRPDADGFDVNSIAIQEAVECGPPPPAAGCSHGYYKNHTVAGENNTFASYGITGSGRDGSTLKSSTGLKGGSSLQAAKDNLLKQLGAALLNAALVPGYPQTTTQLVSRANGAFASGSRATILDLAAELDRYNNLGCPLN